MNKIPVVPPSVSPDGTETVDTNRAHSWIRWIAGFAVGLSVWLLLLFAAALAGIYFALSVVISGIIAAGIAYTIVRRIERLGTALNDVPKVPALALCLIIGVSLLTVAYHHDLPRGRDEAIYASAAYLLEQHHALRIDDPYAQFIGGMVDAPGGGWTIQFFPGYPLYLGGMDALLGRNGIRIGNAVLVFGGLLSIVLIGMVVARRSAGVVVALILGTSYVFQWFPRRTLSENLFFLLFWIATLLLLYGITKRQYAIAFAALFPLGTLSFVRLEGALYLLAAVAVLLVASRHRRTEENGRALRFAMRVGAGFVLSTAVLMAWYLIRVNTTYTESIVTRFIDSISGAVWSILGISAVIGVLLMTWKRVGTVPTMSLVRRTLRPLSALAVLILLLLVVSTYDRNVATSVLIPLYTLLVLSVFAVLPLYAMMLMPIPWRRIRSLGIVGLLCVPVLLLFINPQIRFDLPWFLRRFYPVFIPLTALTFSVLVTSSAWRVIRTVAIACVTIVQLVLSLPLIAYQDHQGAYARLETFAQRFSRDDLLIMAPNTNGNRWGIVLHYLFRLDVIVSTSFSDDARALTPLIRSHRNVYLITDEPYQPPFYHSPRFVRETPYSFSVPELIATNEQLFSQLQHRTSAPLSLLTTSRSSSIVPTAVTPVQEAWYIYKLNEPMLLLQASTQ